MKDTIEDNAFAMWDCAKDGETYEESAKNFVSNYLDQFPAFKEFWDEKELAEMLLERL